MKKKKGRRRSSMKRSARKTRLNARFGADRY
jgi:hypothetical protein